jgi:hypothetical protein
MNTGSAKEDAMLWFNNPEAVYTIADSRRHTPTFPGHPTSETLDR